MSDEIDRLEIAVETEAGRANRSLGGMEKRLNKIADTLEKVVTLTAGLGNFDKFDFGGLADFHKELDSIFKSQRKMSRNNGMKIDDSGLKYAKKSMQELQNQFKDSKLNVDISVMGESELKRFILQTERRYNRLKQSLSDTIELNGSDVIGGKAWHRANMQAMQYKNALDDATEALGRMKAMRDNVSDIKINRGFSYSSSEGGETPRSALSDAKSFNYNSDAMKYVFGEGAEDLRNFSDVMREFSGNANQAGIAINDFEGKMDTNIVSTYEAQIKRLKRELADLASQGYSQYDPEYDRVAQELAEVTEAQKFYNKTLRESAKESLGIRNAKKLSDSIGDAAKKAGIFKRTIDGIKASSKKINSIKKSFDDVGKAIKNAHKMANGAIHPFKTLRNLISGENSSRKGMSWGRMIGSSLLFNFVFKGISAIQNAIKEGSDNLVQYSTEYNHSISSMVSSLLYLKNAWAAAFSPITNVVAPYISQFIDMIASAINAVGQFMAALTGKGFAVQAKKVWKDYASGLDTTKDSAGAAEKALKDLQNYTLGIDELNLIQPNDNSGSGSGSGGSGGSDISPSDMFETIEVSDSMSTLAQKFKEAIEKSDFTEIGQMIGNKLAGAMEGINWDSVYQKASNFGKGLSTFLNGLISPELFYDLGLTIANSINTAFHSANAFAINFDWENLGESISSSIKGFFENWDAGLTAETFSNFASGILNAMTSAVQKLGDDKTFEDIGQKLVDFLCGVDWIGLTWDLSGFFDAFSEALYDFPSDMAKGVAKSILKKISGTDVEIEIPKWFNDFIKRMTLYNVPAIKILDWIPNVEDIKKKLEEIRGAFSTFADAIAIIISGSGDFFVSCFDWSYKVVTKTFEGIGKFFKGLFDGVQVIIDKFAPKSFQEAFSKARKSVEDAFKGIGDFFRGIANGIISPIGKAVNGVIGGVNWVLGKLGSGETIAKWDVPKFSSGTNGLSKDTIGIVNDQKGATYRELILPPNGKPFIPKGRNVMLSLQKGTKIMPADETKAFMSGMPKFAGGIGEFFGNAWSKAKDFTGNVLDYITHPEKIVQIAIDKFVDISGVSDPLFSIAKGSVKTMFDVAVDFVRKIFDKDRTEKYNHFDGVGKINISDVFPTLSEGGVIPRKGQMFVARERGPELVGEYNGRATVMNNDQIVKSVSNGVEAAFERQNAMTNSLLREIAEYQKMLLNKETSVNIDGKKADKQLAKARRNSGYSFSPA